jgi:hypothetical protein
LIELEDSCRNLVAIAVIFEMRLKLSINSKNHQHVILNGARKYVDRGLFIKQGMKEWRGDTLSFVIYPD